MSQSKFTWGQLKEFVNSLPENQLSNEIIWWGDERGGKLTGAKELEEEYISVGEGMEERSGFFVIGQDDEANAGLLYRIEPDEIEVSLPAGTPILYVD